VGFKNFLAGNPLAAADVMTYLMYQSVVTCTSSTRPSVPPQGMVIYETDTDTFLYCSNSVGPIWNSLMSGEIFWQQQSPNTGDVGPGVFTTEVTIASAISIPTWARDGTALLDLDVSFNPLIITTTGTFRIRLAVGATNGIPYEIAGDGTAGFDAKFVRMRMQYTIPAATTTLSPVIQVIRDIGTAGLRISNAANTVVDWNYSIHR